MSINKEAMDDHVTTIPMSWLRENCRCEECIRCAIESSALKFADPQNVPRVSYDSLESKEGKFQYVGRNMGILSRQPTENLYYSDA